MSFFLCTGRNKKKYQKFALVDLFRAPVKTKSKLKAIEEDKMNAFVNELAEENVSFSKIQTLAWNGVPQCVRPKVWRYLLRYSLVHAEEATLSKKRSEYTILKNNYWKKYQQLSQADRKIYQTINGDVKRIGSDFNSAFQENTVQQSIKSLLYIWHARHPASGYVQGICDLTIPFLIVFFSEYIPLNEAQQKFLVPLSTLQGETLLSIEADTYWCLSKLLEFVTKNYTNGFAGLQQSYSKTQQILYKIDEELYNHFRKEKFDLFAFSFRSISTMMLRCFSPLTGVRLFDTLISLEEEYPVFMIYFLIAILEKFAKKILELRSDQLMTFMQKLPTKSWQSEDIDMIIAEAYVYKKLYSQKE